MTKQRQTRRAERDDAWGVTVRLNDGRILYFTGQDSRRGGQDWASASMAHRFDSREEAQSYAALGQTNSVAWAYQIAPLPEPR